MAEYQIFEGTDGQWRFRLMANNGEQVGRDSQGYRDRTDALRGAKDHQSAAVQAEIEGED